MQVIRASDKEQTRDYDPVSKDAIQFADSVTIMCKHCENPVEIDDDKAGCGNCGMITFTCKRCNWSVAYGE